MYFVHVFFPQMSYLKSESPQPRCPRCELSKAKSRLLPINNYYKKTTTQTQYTTPHIKKKKNHLTTLFLFSAEMIIELSINGSSLCAACVFVQGAKIVSV